MVTLGDYEISVSAGCPGYVNISNSAILEDNNTQSSSLQNHQLFWVHQHSPHSSWAWASSSHGPGTIPNR